MPDIRVLIPVAYLPIVLLGNPFGWPPGADLGEFFQLTVLKPLFCMMGGVAFAGATLPGQHRLADACASCGRRKGADRLTPPEAAARWGAGATWIAVLLPLFCPVTRWAWVPGIPLGVTSEFLREEAEERPMICFAGAFLASFGALGLIRPWGGRFPRRVGRLARKPIPPRLAIVPASVIAILIVETGIMYNRMALTETWDDEFRTGNWATVVLEVTWPLRGLALGSAVLAYQYRRRGRCEACSRA